MLLYFVLLSLASDWMTVERQLDTATKDFALSLLKAASSAVGSGLMAFAPNLATLAVGPVVVVLGSSTPVTLRSFLASHVEVAAAGRLFTGISTVATVGGFLGLPLMGLLYSWGVSTGLRAVALPFLVSAVGR
jgi:MFS family permease